MNVNTYFKNECSKKEISTELIESLNLKSSETSIFLQLTRIGAAAILTAGVVTLVAGIVLMNMPALIAGSTVCAFTAVILYVIQRNDYYKAIRLAVGVTSEMDTAISKHKEKLNATEDEKSSLTEKLGAAETEVGTMTKKIEKLSKEVMDLKSNLESTENKILDLNNKLQPLQKENNKKSTDLEMNNFKKDRDNAQSALEKKSAELKTAEQTHSEFKKTSKITFDSELNKLQKSNNELKMELNKDKDLLSDLQLKLDEKIIENNDQRQQIDANLKSIEEKSTKIVELVVKQKKTEVDLQKLDGKLKVAMGSPVKGTNVIVDESKKTRGDTKEQIINTDALLRRLSDSDEEKI